MNFMGHERDLESRLVKIVRKALKNPEEAERFVEEAMLESGSYIVSYPDEPLPPLLRARIDAQKREQERAYRKLMAENAIPQL